MFKVPEKYRITSGAGPMNSTLNDGNNGAFLIKHLKLRRPIMVIASDGYGWEHVSVSLPDRCPTWGEMCIIKALFWDSEDCVVQYHPPSSVYVNDHPYVLHLWRPVGVNLPMPDQIMV